jgi:hypothetical protein
MLSNQEAIEYFIKFLGSHWKMEDGCMTSYFDMYSYQDGGLQSWIDAIKEAYPSLKLNKTIDSRLLSDSALEEIIDGMKVCPSKRGVNILIDSKFSKDKTGKGRLIFSIEIVKKLAELFYLQQKVAKHLMHLTGVTWKAQLGKVLLSDSWLSDLSEFDKAVKIIKQHYQDHFSVIKGKWDRSVIISMEGVEAIAKLMSD